MRRVAWGLAALLSVACGGGTKYMLAGSSSVPAARGEVKAKQTDDGNTRLHVRVKHLAPPESVGQMATTYVVWARPSNGDPPENLGALRVDEKLNGHLETLTALKAFELFVTAEPAPTAREPSGERLLWTSVRQK